MVITVNYNQAYEYTTHILIVDLAMQSARDGNCGTGVACGIIARSAGLGENTKRICACDGVSVIFTLFLIPLYRVFFLTGPPKNPPPPPPKMSKY